MPAEDWLITSRRPYCPECDWEGEPHPDQEHRDLQIDAHNDLHHPEVGR